MSINQNAEVILVNSPIRVSTGEQKDMRIPLGLLYLGSILRENGIAAKLFDMQQRCTSIKSIEDYISKKKGKFIVGFTCDSDNIFRVLRLSDYLLEKHENILVVLGGPHVTCVDKPYVTERRLVVRGEGEYPILLLAKHFLFNEGELHNIPSITYSSFGKLKCNPISYGPYEDINKIPLPDYSLLTDYENYFPSVMTSRGCMYNCHFCSEGRTNHRYRPRNSTSVEQELQRIKELYGNKLRYLTFNDDTFTASHDRVVEMCDVIDRVFTDKNMFGFYCEGRVNTLAKHPKLIKRLKEAGLIRLQIGIESGNQNTLERINKKIRVAEIKKVIDVAASEGISTIFGAFICGLPGQTCEEIYGDIAFAKQLIDIAPEKVELEVGMLAPMPGTEFRENSEKWGLTIFDPEFVTGSVIEDCLCETIHLKKDQITELCLLFKREVDLYIREKISLLPPEKIKESFILTAERHLVPLIVRKLCQFKHANRLLTLRAREDHRFLFEIPIGNQICASPCHVNSTITPCNDEFIINEGSLLAFSLSKDEMRYYKYFYGKLSFEGIASKIAEDETNKKSKTLEECLNVYKKCEDNLSAITMI